VGRHQAPHRLEVPVRLAIHAADGSRPLADAPVVAGDTIAVSDRPMDVRLSGPVAPWREDGPWLVLAVEGTAAPHTLGLSRLRAAAPADQRPPARRTTGP
jgi:hypothetical protein